jgi:hypothetical protein
VGEIGVDSSETSVNTHTNMWRHNPEICHLNLVHVTGFTSSFHSQSVSQKIVDILRQPKVLYLVQRSPPLEPNLSHLDPAHTHSIILSSTFKVPVWSFLFSFSNQNFICNSYIKFVCCLPRTYNPSLFISKTNQAYRNLRRSSLCNFFRSFVISTFLIFLPCSETWCEIRLICD